MQGKGIIKFFLVVLTIMCLLQYFYLLPTSKVENNAESYAQSLASNIADPAQKNEAISAARSAYLDSMSSEVIFSIPMLKKYTYDDLKNAQLNFGLDLKGGMSVVLQVDLKDFLKNVAGNSKDPNFLTALDNAEKAQANSQADYISLFAEEYKKVAPNGSLRNIFARGALKEEIGTKNSNADIIVLLRETATETVDLTYKRLKERIDELGVVQPNVSLDAARDLILVELPGITNPERARNFLASTAKLEFWKTYRINDNVNILAALQEADRKLGVGSNNPEAADYTIETKYNYTYNDDGNITDSTAYQDTIRNVANQLNSGGPLLSLLQLNGQTGAGISYPLTVVGVAAKNKIDRINKYLAQPNIKALFPKDLKFMWGYAKINYLSEESSQPMYELYAIKTSRGDKALLEGDVITGASSNPDPTTQKITVSLQMNGEGARKWGQITTEAAQDNNREIAISLDNKVVSAPSVNGAIPNGSSAITGNFTRQEGDDFAKILEIGKLPAQTKIIQEQVVGPSLGAENISRSLNSMIIGLGLVLFFMIAYYGGGGIVSIIALLANLFFIGGALANFGTVLTLPGVAGIILTIGMAVDANVIIYERIREELREGKSTLAAIKDGFQQSYSAIIDANVTTILTACVLAYFGLGPIKGFAVILIIGVISSLFTAVLVGRLMINWWTEKGNEMSFWTGFSKNAFANLNIDWLGKRKIAYVLSAIIIVGGLVSMAVRGFELGVDFKGGYSYNIQFDPGQNVSADDLRTALAEPFGKEPIVKAVSTQNTYNVTTDYLITDNGEDASDIVMNELFTGVNSLVGGNLNEDQFKNPNGIGAHVTSSNKVGPNIADDIKTSSFYAAVLALLFIFFYIFVRFNRWQYSAGAVAALFHDTLVVLAVFSIFHGILPFAMTIDQAFIAAILTVIGYSINDTVVVFDRIREFMGLYTSKSKEEIINRAINSTVSRTVITSLTTLFVVAILLFFGGSSIRGFAFALFIGIIVGTYSSVFIATPIMSDLSKDLKPKKTKKGSSKESAFKRRVVEP